MANGKTSEPWWRGASVYQIYPRSFLDTNGDGIGDLPGITSKLDYVASLNVDGIWLSPFFTSPMADFGYDVADYRDVDPIFGTLDDFDALVRRAHSLGLKAIIDQVYCHTSDRHDWFAQSKTGLTNAKADWYVWADAKPDGSPPNNWQSVFSGPAWTWDAVRKQYYLHHFLKQQPTLNLHNQEVVDALIDVGKFWIEHGVDGFRLDALNLGMVDQKLRDNPASGAGSEAGRPFAMQDHTFSMSHPAMIPLIERLAASYKAAGGDEFFTVAEIGGEEPFPTMLDYTSGEGRLSSAYSFDFIGSSEFSTSHIRDVVEHWANEGTDGYPGFAFSNHDCARVASRWARKEGEAGNFVKLLFLLQSALSGVMFVYQGEELGLPQVDIPFDQMVDPEGIANYPNDSGRDGARTPMPWDAALPHNGFSTSEPWLPSCAAHGRLAVANQMADPNSNLSFFKTAMALRAANAPLRHGSIRFLDAPQDAIAFERELDGGGSSLCVANFGSEPITLSWDAPADHASLLSIGDVTAAGSQVNAEPHSGAIIG